MQSTMKIDWSVFRLSVERFTLVFKIDRGLVLEDMMADIDRLIRSVATRFCDATSTQLEHEELVGECRLKLVELINKGHLQKQKKRSDFFALLKASLQNLCRSKVGRYRFTEKRTGVKPPPRDAKLSAEEAAEYTLRQKQVELRLDDTDQHLQVASTDHSHSEEKEIVEEYAALLSPFEQYVYYQLIQPNDIALAEAYIDSCRGKRSGQKQRVHIKDEHLAKGLQISVEQYTNAVLSIRQKISAYRHMSEEDQKATIRRNAVIAQLKTVFGVQIPSSADDMLLKRLFTIAARDQYTKITVEVAELLEEIGAKVPRVHRDMLSCYGVLFQEHDRRCQSCGLKKSCEVEAANIGLSQITISPRLLGSRQVRSPIILPTCPVKAPVVTSMSEAEILTYIQDFCATFKRGSETYYGHSADGEAHQVLLFHVGSQATPMQLRFCTPCESLKTKLTKKGKGWYLPDNISAQEAMALIDQHAKETANESK